MAEGSNEIEHFILKEEIGRRLILCLSIVIKKMDFHHF